MSILLAYLVCMGLAAYLYGIAFGKFGPHDDEGGLVVIGVIFAPLSLIGFTLFGLGWLIYKAWEAGTRRS